MNFTKSTLAISLGTFILGAGAMYGLQNYKLSPKANLERGETVAETKEESTPATPRKLTFKNSKMKSIFDQFYNDDFFDRSHDPFEEMRKMRERMMKDFEDPQEGLGFFDSWYQGKFGGGSAGEVKKREDEKSVYFDVTIKDVDPKKINIKVENGQIQISGTVEKKVEKKSENGDEASYSSSSFHRSFPVPPQVDASKVQIDQQGDKLVLKFPKLT